MAAEFLLVPSLVMGALIGIIELIFVHADEKGLGWLSHGLHTLPIAMVLTFVGMNLEFAAGLANFSFQSNFWLDAGVRVLLAIIAAVKVKGAAAIVQGHNSVGEKMGHALIIGALIGASPYIWGVIAPIVPVWLGGGK